MSNPTQASWRALVFGGILPVIAFAVIEEYYGVAAGLVAGMIFGGGEILYEWIALKRVQTMTWIGNGMLLGLGAISLFTQEGIWFKLQPALMELGFGLILIGSTLLRKPLFIEMARKQGTLPTDGHPEVLKIIESSFRGMTWRSGVFFLLHCALAIWAALYWSTEAWAWLKGAGVTGSLLVYGVVEVLVLRYRIAKWHQSRRTPP